MIVKVQISQSDGGRKVLVYDKDRRHVYEGPADPGLKTLMGGRAKAYFRAEISGESIVLGEPVGDRTW